MAIVKGWRCTKCRAEVCHVMNENGERGENALLVYEADLATEHENGPCGGRTARFAVSEEDFKRGLR